MFGIRLKNYSIGGVVGVGVGVPVGVGEGVIDGFGVGDGLARVETDWTSMVWVAGK